MQKYILTAILFCLCTMMRGQSGYEYTYWTDGNVSKQTTITSDTGIEQLQVDVSGLDNGFHTLNVMVKDKNGVVSPTVTRMFYSAKEVTSSRGWYQIDNQSEVFMVDQMQGLHMVDVSMLTNGLHSIRFMLEGVDGKVTSFAVGHFIKLSALGEEMTYTYIYDKDSTTAESRTLTTNVMWLDVEGLADGLHTIDIIASASSTIQPVSHRFIKIPQTDGVDFLNCVCYIDEVLYKQEKIESAQGIVEWDIDMTAVERGLHNIELQVVSPSGAASLLSNSLFLRTLTDVEFTTLDCYCIIDSIHTSIVEGLYEDCGYSFELDVDNLDDGNHTLTYLLLDNTGVVTDARIATFVKDSKAHGVGKLEIVDEKKTVIYDLSGHPVNRIVTSGIYIINGNKVMIKKKF
ncbi:MAG: hypothetical protein II999_03765 [Bacteroidaceae bacterium]|nr:hypothetical protein [Bacteroidaceae bacterium]